MSENEGSRSTVQVDSIPVAQDSAAFLVIHHLGLAAAYFQGIPEGSLGFERKLLEGVADTMMQGYPTERAATQAFIESITQSYDDTLDEDERAEKQARLDHEVNFQYHRLGHD